MRTDNGGNAVPEATVELDVVPAGKLLVVEHVPGRLAVRDGDVVEFLQAGAQGADSVAFLPVALVSSPSQFGAAQGSVVGISSAHRPGSMWARETNSSSLAEQTRHSGCSPRLSGIWSMSEHCCGARLSSTAARSGELAVVRYCAGRNSRE